MSALQRFVALGAEIVAAGRTARRTGRDQTLGCGRCRVDATLDAATFDRQCTVHEPMLAAYDARRRIAQEGEPSTRARA